MLYPIEEEYSVKVVEGGWIQLLLDMVLFCAKVFIFFFVGWTALWSMLWVWSEYANKNLSASCLEELANMGE